MIEPKIGALMIQRPMVGFNDPRDLHVYLGCNLLLPLDIDQQQEWTEFFGRPWRTVISINSWMILSDGPREETDE